MLCTNCGAANADDAKVCVSCGQPLSGVWDSPKSDLVSSDLETGGEISYAGFWERFAALILDNLILLGAWLVFAFIFAFIFGLIIGLVSVGGSSAATLQRYMPFFALASYGVFFLLVGSYFVLMESGEQGATFGKRVLKVRVVDADGRRISRGRALGRFAAHWISDITLCIGYLIQPFTPRKQALHDMISGTLVVKTERNSGGLAIVVGIVASFFLIVIIIAILAALAIPKYQDYLGRANLMRAEVVGRVATQAVEKYAAQTGKIPASLEETGVKLPPAPEVANVTVSPKDGQVRVEIGKGMPRGAAGKALVFDATRNSKGKIVWVCTGPGIPKDMLPPDCH